MYILAQEAYLPYSSDGTETSSLVVVVVGDISGRCVDLACS